MKNVKLRIFFLCSLWGMVITFAFTGDIDHSQREPASFEDEIRIEKLITPETYRDIKKITLSLYHYCPPDDCIFIALGRSPAPFSAYIKLLTDNIINLPLSGFMLHPKLLTYDNDLEEKLYAHFDKYLDYQKIGNRKVVLFDFAMSGTSLFSAQYHLEKYLNLVIGTKEVLPVALTNYPSAVMNTIDRIGIKNYEIKTISEGTLQKALINSDFDKFAEFGVATVNFWGNVSRNSRSLELENELFKYYQKDQMIRGFGRSNYRRFLPQLKVSPATLGTCRNWYSKLLEN